MPSCCRYDVETGELTATLFEEKSDKYVEYQDPIIFLPWDNSKFIYQSQKRWLQPPLPVRYERPANPSVDRGRLAGKRGSGLRHQEKEIIIASTEFSPLQNNLFRLDTKTGIRTPWAVQKAYTADQLSPSGRYLIDQYNSPTVPRSINIIDVQSGKSVNLLTAADPFTGYKMPGIETGTIKAADGKTDLYYRLIKPADFDPNKKYPAIVYVYGGPHAQLVTNGWQNGARGWDIYMANKGYIMFTVDGRGSSNQGTRF